MCCAPRLWALCETSKEERFCEMSEGSEKNAISSETADLAVEGSSPMAAYVARPSRLGRHPGLMVFQEAFGVNHHIRDVTERFAAQGYVAIAPELFHRTAPKGFERRLQELSFGEAALPSTNERGGRS